jgi:hypothetical protein
VPRAQRGHWPVSVQARTNGALQIFVGGLQVLVCVASCYQQRKRHCRTSYGLRFVQCLTWRAWPGGWEALQDTMTQRVTGYGTKHCSAPLGLLTAPWASTAWCETEQESLCVDSSASNKPASKRMPLCESQGPIFRPA